MININVKEYIPFEEGFNSSLTLEFSGKDINQKIVNAIRRYSTIYIPTYAYHPDNINITKNNVTAINNDIMKLRLSTLPVFNIDPEIITLEDKYWKVTNMSMREKHIKEKNIVAYVNATNTTQNTINITTHDFIVKIDGETDQMYKNVDPIIIIKLPPNTTFTCSMTASLGIGYKHDIWSGIQNGYYEVNNNIITLTCESVGKQNIYKILIKACEVILNRLTSLTEILNHKQDNEIITLEFIEEDYSLADIINYEFQSNKNIDFSGILYPDMFKNTVIIKLSNKDNIEIYMIESITKLINIFNKILAIIKKFVYK